MKHPTLALLLGLPVAAACHPRLEPAMCAFTAGQVDSAGAVLDPATFDAYAAGAGGGAAAAACNTGAFHVKAGEGFFLVYQMPAGINAPDPIEIKLTTPCGTTTLSRDHADDATRLVIPLVAPAGAGCALSVSASLANSELSQVAQGEAAACAAEKLACPVVDAGTGGTSTGSTSGSSSTGSGGASGG